MANQDTTVFLDPQNNPVEIPLSYISIAKDDQILLDQFITGVRLNASHGYQLYHDPSYFLILKNNFSSINDVILAVEKYALGERILTDYGFNIEIARMALGVALYGLSSLINGIPTNISLLPIVVENGILQPISDEVVQNAIITLSNTPLFFSILKNRKLI